MAQCQVRVERKNSNELRNDADVKEAAGKRVGNKLILSKKKKEVIKDVLE